MGGLWPRRSIWNVPCGWVALRPPDVGKRSGDPRDVGWRRPFGDGMSNVIDM